MSGARALAASIRRAVSNGWEPFWKTDKWTVDDTAHIFAYSDMFSGPGYMTFSWEEVIFNHGFAKALWGEAPVAITKDSARRVLYSSADWRYHLQQMVIAPDPLQYLVPTLPASKPSATPPSTMRADVETV